MDGRIEFHVDLRFLFFAVFFLLMFPARWVLGFLLAVSVHEYGHLLALCFLNGDFSEVRIGFSGMAIEMEELAPARELLAAAAGPVLGGCVFCLEPWLREAAVSAFFLTVFNLLPVYPRDGGRVLRALCSILWKSKGLFIYCCAETIISTLLMTVSLIRMLSGHFRLLWLLLFASLSVDFLTGKIPCK